MHSLHRMGCPRKRGDTTSHSKSFVIRCAPMYSTVKHYRLSHNDNDNHNCCITSTPHQFTPVTTSSPYQPLCQVTAKIKIKEKTSRKVKMAQVCIIVEALKQIAGQLISSNIISCSYQLHAFSLLKGNFSIAAFPKRFAAILWLVAS